MPVHTISAKHAPRPISGAAASIITWEPPELHAAVAGEAHRAPLQRTEDVGYSVDSCTPDKLLLRAIYCRLDQTLY
jgi:hypothetical protein